jgi:hypothetical protein
MIPNATDIDLQTCQFMIVQGVGSYDYVPLDD